jgi:hypothetical protein
VQWPPAAAGSAADWCATADAAWPLMLRHQQPKMVFFNTTTYNGEQLLIVSVLD